MCKIKFKLIKEQSEIMENNHITHVVHIYIINYNYSY